MTDYRSQWARRVIREKLFQELTLLSSRPPSGNAPRVPIVGMIPPPESPLDLPPIESLHKGANGAPSTPELPEDFKVCIIGAGIAGLYIALILDKLQIPHLSYKILEASDRVGGRVYTHNFSRTAHDYYDIGAMRYPDIPIMRRTFDLFKMMNISTIPYYLQGKNCPQRFNDRTVLPTAVTETDPFHVSVAKGGSVPNDVVDTWSSILEASFRPYKDEMKKNFEDGFAMLMEVDNYSTREYLKRPVKPGEIGGYDFYSIQWMETQNTSTGLFDQAFSESVMDSFDFDYGPNVQWHCIEGGTEILTKAMQAEIDKKPEPPIQKNTRVTGIGIDRSKEGTDNNIIVHCAEGEPQPYATVFNTTSLGCLQRMDLTELELHPTQKDAIRCLHYDHSVKVAIKFRHPWWRTKCGIVEGGVASTDLPLRTCVYPSYNIHDSEDEPAVLLVSYTWAQDATRVASLVKNEAHPQPDPDCALMQVILYNLWLLHCNNIKSVEDIKEEYMEHHAYSWSDDPDMAGAFALYGPGQFSNFYAYLTRPAADSKFHIVGEASSTHHAWIVGALDSAYAAVHRFLLRFKQHDYITKLEKMFNTVDELEPGLHGTEDWQVVLGMLRKGQHVTV
ncbi:hypothetical protein EYZ11_011931 [Aspergillus tanneri]|uniref:Amine oxidase domain-containing protein n=1 Tax=Aspergillus tanneri TaxID=1220188 RepID=A0A4S3J1I2_9EURO|nr:uncharacterized protein ATNIH1004_007255 [Aspergillus tanneri]KAA8645834.1 hypothetical protein ATNIH1004_007255 [Aspergillus tanneri]THC88619.1 hypothetical protein EYZ11_011931 [Aspergillus tanneri]